MNRLNLLFAIVTLSLVARHAQAQNVTVQLPTISIFSVATTVVVPDRGSVYLGGVKRASFGSNTVGVPGLSKIPGAGRLVRNSAIGSEVSDSSVHATATIMDLDELDRAVLSEAAAKRGVASATGGRTTNPAVERKAAFIAKHIAKNNPAPVKSALPLSKQQARQK